MTIADRLSAALADRYRVERELGAGGMATVYLAADLKHDRKVAIKVLKPELAAVLGAERFVQEIKTTAALSHPHILPLFDSGEADGFLYYVMPYIEGETIREKLNRETQFGIEEAIRITTEIADALDYAHRHGVIHRDIKPENILLHDGRPMVMDFGIALAVSAAAGGRMTETGLSLGTPHYMSPEQATADKAITARSDVYSLAGVLYEMLAGEPPHMGNSAQQIIMKIIAETPRPVTELRKSVPPNVAAALVRALEKLPADRFDSARAFADALTNTGFTNGTTSVPGARTSRARVAWRGIALGALVVAVAGWSVAVTALSRKATVQPLRVIVPLPEGSHFAAVRGNEVALSRDGSLMVFVAEANGVAQLYSRKLTELDAHPIPGSEYLSAPSVSLDNLQVAAQSGGVGGTGDIRVIPIEGGRTVTVATAALTPAWADDGSLLYNDDADNILRWTASGVSQFGQAKLPYPHLLPGSNAILGEFLPNNNVEKARVVVSADDGVHDLFPGAGPLYAAGHIVYATWDGVLRAVPFDVRKLAVTGPPFVVAYDVQVKVGGAAQFSVAQTGLVLYKQGARETRHLVWLRAGGQREQVDSGFTYRFLRTPVLAPDEARIAITGQNTLAPLQNDSSGALWIIEPRRGTRLRLAEAGRAFAIAWSRDGVHVYYGRTDADGIGIWRVRSDGTGAPERIVRTSQPSYGGGITADGTRLIYAAGDDVFVARLGRDTVGTLLLAGAAEPVLSPDGRWLAFSSTKGNHAVALVPFPDVNSQRVVASAGEAYGPRWCRGGRELRFYNRDRLLAVQFDGGSASAPTEVTASVAAPWVMGYAVTADCSRLLIAESSQNVGRLVLVHNFLALAPPK